jgi:hypothetical protein
MPPLVDGPRPETKYIAAVRYPTKIKIEARVRPQLCPNSNAPPEVEHATPRYTNAFVDRGNSMLERIPAIPATISARDDKKSGRGMGNILLPIVPDDQSPLASGVLPAREADQQEA